MALLGALTDLRQALTFFCMVGALNVPNDQQYVVSELRCLRLLGHALALNGSGGSDRA
jgi:hypothetical protein